MILTLVGALASLVAARAHAAAEREVLLVCQSALVEGHAPIKLMIIHQL